MIPEAIYRLVFLILGLTVASSSLAADVEGMPITRVYPLEEIGGVSRGGRLTFDQFGRVAVVQDGAYVVLNDTVWTDTAAAESRIKILQAANNNKGGTFYGALGNWGRLHLDKSGGLYPQTLTPKNCPDWVARTNFADILITPSAVYFSGWNGIAIWNTTNDTNQFLAVPEVASVFNLGETIYVSSHVRGLMKIDTKTTTLVPVDSGTLGVNSVINHCAIFGSGKALLSSSNRRFFLWDNGQITDFPGPLQSVAPAMITALQPLAEGDVAVAILNSGVFIVNQDGQIKLALTGPNYRQVTALAAQEPGVLWAMTENAVQKIFYQKQITLFDQSLGILVEWPQLVSWNDRTLAASGGHLFEAKIGKLGEPARFDRVASEPIPGTWGIATMGPWLLTANARGVFARKPGRDFEIILNDINAARLAVTKSGDCYVIGSEEIAVLRCNEGHWEECEPRIKGVGFPSIIHTAADSVWIELGADRAARVTFRSGKLEARVFDSFPWPEPHWVNISLIGHKAVLSGTDNQRLFFDEQTEKFTNAPELSRIIDLCPSAPYRLTQDDNNTIWASMARGVITFTPRNGEYLIDSTSYDLITERIPIVQALPNQEIWISTGVSLYHANTKSAPVAPADFRPVMVSLRDSRTNTELNRELIVADKLSRFSAKQNSLSLTFFAGSYRYRLPPRYEFRLNNDSWKPSTQGSTLVLSDLYEGNYTLEARLLGQRGVVGKPMLLNFSVAPPWHRAWYALIIYPILAGTVLFAISRYSIRRARARSEALEKLVAERTSELKTTMGKLHNETITSAMLTERARLANEIHDSLEQGFTGLQFQLETTANFHNGSPEIKPGLAVALSMVSYCRNEVRHAVRNLHAPILDSTDLATAVQHIVTQIAPDKNYATVTVTGKQRRLDLTIEHHLLRIAQEAMANAVKHSSATRVEVAIDFRELEVQLTIRDNGCGFEPAIELKSGIGHFGLPSFRGRASAIGGTVEISSSSGAGTCITVRVPLHISPVF